ncbi:sodium:solute symporter family transporter [Pontiella sulfatireligans]|uniref:Sodium/glucose cotransporter n=1 Tax=Pontiella sulfatireligans TaxID=2750658 RepID=A0A6C2UPS8_9BACT|nr:hypothetical protein [Pontiella sulfatireligans]VGO21933.1 Sodium/glucose cotransporter [Pontiella sulfatireligans]
MNWLDIITIIISFSAIMGVGLMFAKRVSNSTDEYMTGGRNLPWWLAGTSLSAGSFNSDTPLHNSRRAREQGLAGLWLYFGQLITQSLAALVFVKFARRSGISTWVEIYDMRHGGRAGKYNRIFNVFFQGFYGRGMTLVLGLVAMIKVSEAVFDYPETFRLIGMTFNSNMLIMVFAVVFAMVYASASGLWGVVATDFLEFLIALVCSFILTVLVLKECGWGDGLSAELAKRTTTAGQSFFSLIPKVGLPLFLWIFITPWAGGSQICTNMRYLGAKDEKEAILSGVWQTFNNFILRSWPWWIAGLASVVLLSGIEDSEMAYPQLIRTYMPAGLRGLMVAGFMSAFLSTIDTCFHETSSTFLNDLYRPYIKPDESEKHYLWAARICILVVAVLGVLMATMFDDLLGLFMFGMKVGGMHGIISVYRWFWHRLNGWADFVGNVLSVPLGVMLHFDANIAQSMGFERGPTDVIIDFVGTRILGTDASDGRWAIQYLIGISLMTLIVTVLSYVTPKDDPEVVDDFYRRIRPYGLWKPVSERTGLKKVDSFIKDILMTWLSIAYTFIGIAAGGLLFFAKWGWGILAGLVSATLCVLFVKLIHRMYHDNDDIKAFEAMEQAERHNAKT